MQIKQLAPSILVPFAIGGLSGAVATSIIQPIDTLKVQIQVHSEQLGKNNKHQLTINNILTKIHSSQGFQVLYRGLGSAIYRQIVYASARIGSYQSSLKHFQSHFNRKTTKFQKIILSIMSGAFGALVGNPFDVALVRRQASIATNKNAYKNTFHAFSSITKTEGFLSLWRGLNITILRVAIINIGQLAGKDIISDYMQPFQLSKQMNSNLVAFGASVVTAIISLPVDNIKVKLQKQDNAELIYKGIYDCFIKSINREGFFRLWVGLPIYFIRGTPHSFILLKTQYLLNQLYSNRSKVQ